jgi:hypothetical protein
MAEFVGMDPEPDACTVRWKRSDRHSTSTGRPSRSSRRFGLTLSGLIRFT